MPTVVHVYPVGDLIEHGTDSTEADCVCGPTTEPVPRDDGSIGWVITHHSLDGREQREEEPMTTTPSPTFQVLGREPALWLGLLRGLIYAVSVFVIPVSDTVAAAIIAAAAAGFGLAEAAVVAREKLVPMLMGFTEAVLALVLAFGVELSAEQTGVAMFLVAAAVSFATRTQVTAPVDADGNLVPKHGLAA
ncbi:hypothetical protein [Nocardiopsis sp. FR26]|uniref:hypothetical protein n=1 Tax=Nocardiopsis sp. FR26 TaxID=2605987 RepID=UPI00135766F9|nr:hypothetical protein [Nocardiopsis sp. FR26]